MEDRCHAAPRSQTSRAAREEHVSLSAPVHIAYQATLRSGFAAFSLAAHSLVPLSARDEFESRRIHAVALACRPRPCTRLAVIYRQSLPLQPTPVLALMWRRNANEAAKLATAAGRVVSGTPQSVRTVVEHVTKVRPRSRVQYFHPRHEGDARVLLHLTSLRVTREEVAKRTEQRSESGQCPLPATERAAGIGRAARNWNSA